MASFFTGVFSALPILICLLFIESLSHASQSDIDCLRSIRNSLEDPKRHLNTWSFENTTKGFICNFVGVECWHADDDRVLNIHLGGMELEGTFPVGVVGCSFMTGLDLSNNAIHGSIPNNIDHLVNLLASLDLSNNQLSGHIPVGLANCTYLNVLKLDNNKLTGQIPPEIVLLRRMREFTVANNRLSGPIPHFQNVPVVSAESYANNSGLCGDPLPLCRGSSKKTNTGVIALAAIGGVTLAALGLNIGLFFYIRNMRVRGRKRNEGDPLGNKWAKNMKGVKLSMFDKSVSKMKISDLMKATNDFSKENIMGSGRTGTMYKAVLEDGTCLMVKRLRYTTQQYSHKEFTSEMTTLGSVKHRNLVPLLGLCTTKKERLLIYKHMPNGTLHDKLHVVNQGETPLDWPLRLKIGINAAKGFAWMHHSCNPRIIHRNITSKCILLDSDYEPKISDFGPRLMNPVDDHFIIDGKFGDLGYVAPEYARTLAATPERNVYSFVVVLLELVTGEKPTHVEKAPKSFKGNLVEWISQLSKLQDAIDELLVGKGYDSELFQFLKVACSCVLPGSPEETPTMFQVYQLLRAIGEPYNFATEDDQLEELIIARDV